MSELVREHGEAPGFPVFALEAAKEALARGVLAEEEDGGFGEGPLDMALPIFFPEKP